MKQNKQINQKRPARSIEQQETRAANNAELLSYKVKVACLEDQM